MSKPPAQPTDPRAGQAMREAKESGELRRLAYVATLHPQEREALDPH